MSTRRAAGALALFAALFLTAAGCTPGAGDKLSGNPDTAHGKELFMRGAEGIDACGSCHKLADAGTTGTAGPDLDASFAYLSAKSDDQRFDDEGIANVILGQILHPNAAMKAAKRPSGQDAEDVAAYVAEALAPRVDS